MIDFECEVCTSRRWIECCRTRCRPPAVLWCAACQSHQRFSRIETGDD